MTFKFQIKVPDTLNETQNNFKFFQYVGLELSLLNLNFNNKNKCVKNNILPKLFRLTTQMLLLKKFFLYIATI